MHNQVSNIIRKATANIKKDKYNILTFNTHERYQIQLAKTGHNFFAFRYQGGKEWFPGHGEKPENYYVLPPETIPSIDFDFILSHSKFGQYQISKQINEFLKVPIISLEHTLPIQNWPSQHLNALRSMTGNMNVFISDYSRKAWNLNAPSVVVKHSIDSNKFKPSSYVERKSQVLSVVHSFIERDYCCNYSGWKRITDNISANIRVVGDTPGLSKQSESEEALVREYQESQVFLNTSTVSPIPMALLEAMSCGCAVVSTATCMIPEIIEHGVNGFISNDEKELTSYINMLLNDESLRIKMGEKARQTVIEQFSESAFIKNWNDIFNYIDGANI